MIAETATKHMRTIPASRSGISRKMAMSLVPTSKSRMALITQDMNITSVFISRV